MNAAPHRTQRTQLRQAHQRALWVALGLTTAFMAGEAVSGVTSGSLALLADAGHMLTDAASLGLALLAAWAALRPASRRHSFGYYRSEILATLLNAVALLAITGWIIWEASRRLETPHEASAGVMLGVGIAGVAVNTMGATILRRASAESLNIEGAFIHVLGDLAGSLGIIVAAIIIATTGWTRADPVFSIVIGALILLSSGRLLWKVLHVLMEGTPAKVDVARLCSLLERVPGVTGIHDIHVWSLTSGYELLTAHATTQAESQADREQMLTEMRRIAAQDFGIAHVTIQLESGVECEESHHIEHLPAHEGAHWR